MASPLPPKKPQNPETGEEEESCQETVVPVCCPCLSLVCARLFQGFVFFRVVLLGARAPIYAGNSGPPTVWSFLSGLFGFFGEDNCAFLECGQTATRFGRAMAHSRTPPPLCERFLLPGETT